MSTSKKIWLFCIISAVLVGADRLTKIWAKEYLQYTQPKSYLGDTFRFGYAENTGAFLSFGSDWSPTVSFWVFGVVPLLLLVGFFIYCVKNASRLPFGRLMPFALIFAGGTGNIIDRLLYDRHVTDFMNVGIGESFRSGIFNVADMCVTAAVIILVFQSFKKDKETVATT
ncbi:MAG TPA: signal peptidase II [Chitinophagaceae bacterium]|nr:signal peptidase II [Chitinophagaceae bacterium]